MVTSEILMSGLIQKQGGANYTNGNIIALLTQRIKEAENEIEALRREIESLKAKIK